MRTQKSILLIIYHAHICSPTTAWVKWRFCIFFQTSLASLSLERSGTVTFESSPAFLLTLSIVEARVWVAHAWEMTDVKRRMWDWNESFPISCSPKCYAAAWHVILHRYTGINRQSTWVLPVSASGSWSSKSHSELLESSSSSSSPPSSSKIWKKKSNTIFLLIYIWSIVDIISFLPYKC